MLNVNLDRVQEHIRPLNPSEVGKVEALIKVLVTILNARYGTKITPDNEEVFIYYIGACVSRKLAKPDEMVNQQTTGPFAVSWNAASSKGDLFLPNELSSMDSMVGKKRAYGVLKFSSSPILDR